MLMSLFQTPSLSNSLQTPSEAEEEVKDEKKFHQDSFSKANSSKTSAANKQTASRINPDFLTAFKPQLFSPKTMLNES